MADTYFEVRNKDNVFQFSDNTHLLHIVDKMEFVAEIEKGEIYGVEIPSGVSNVSYSTDEATLYISPECTRDGKRIQYVTSSSDTPIKAYFWSEDYFEPMEHGAGLELRDAKGNIVFNNRGYLGSFKASFYNGVTTFQDIINTENKEQQSDGWPNIYYAKGFPMFYLALCARCFGTYIEYDVSYSEDKSWFQREVSKNCSVHGYQFGGPTGKPQNTASKEYEWVKYPQRGEFGNRSMERYIHAVPARSSGASNSYSMHDIIYGMNAGILVRIDYPWECNITPSSSLMCPMNIWLPSLVGPEKEKNYCYAVGYEFSNNNGQRLIRMESEFETLDIKKVLGAGNIEHLNKVIATGTEKGGWNENASKSMIQEFVHGKDYDFDNYDDGPATIYQYREKGELIAEYCEAEVPNTPREGYYYVGGRMKEEAGTWTATDGIACDISMCHIVDIT